MMHVTHTEVEEIEQLKGWLKDYGPSFLIGVVLALAIGFGWNGWQARQTRITQAASEQYSAVLQNIAKQNDTQARNAATDLMADYKGTPYATWSAMAIAKIDVNDNALDAARAKLEWAMDHANNPSQKQTARIRLAKVLIAQKNPEKALVMLGTVDDNTFQGLIDDAKGDAYLAMGNTDKAREAFTSAIDNLHKQGVQPPAIITMKLQNVDTI